MYLWFLCEQPICRSWVNDDCYIFFFMCGVRQYQMHIIERESKYKSYFGFVD